MKRKFIWNLLLVVILNLLIKPFYILGIDAEVLNQVGPEAYGNYFALINFSFLLNILLDLGITNYNVKNIAQHHHLIDKYFSGIITLRVALVGCYMFATFLIAYFIGYNSTEFQLLFLLAVNQSIVAFILYLRSNLAGLHLFVQDSLISVLDRLLLIIICGVLLWGGITQNRFQIEWFVYAQTAAYLFTLCICFILVIRQTTCFKFRWNFNFAIVILKQSFPYAMLILLMTIYYRIDSIMLERMMGDTQAGIYAQAYRFFEASNMIAYLFAALLLPIFSKMLKNRDSVHELVYFSFKILMGFGFVLTVFAFIYASEIMAWKYDQLTAWGHMTLDDTQGVFRILMICFLFVSATYIYGTLLTANGNLLHLNIIAAFGVVLNIILNYVLIKSYKAEGAAIASLVTQGLTCLAQIILCFYIFKFSFLSIFFRLIIFCFGLILVGFYIRIINDNILIQWLVYFIFSFVWLLTTGLIKTSDFNLLRNNRISIK